MRVSFHESARAELDEAVAHYSDISPGLGRALRDEVSAALDRLIEHPAIGLAVRAELRRFILRRFPYSLIYRATEDRLRILAIMHHKRSPGYWQRRT